MTPVTAPWSGPRQPWTILFWGLLFPTSNIYLPYWCSFQPWHRWPQLQSFLLPKLIRCAIQIWNAKITLHLKKYIHTNTHRHMLTFMSGIQGRCNTHKHILHVCLGHYIVSFPQSLKKNLCLCVVNIYYLLHIGLAKYCRGTRNIKI